MSDSVGFVEFNIQGTFDPRLFKCVISDIGSISWLAGQRYKLNTVGPIAKTNGLAIKRPYTDGSSLGIAFKEIEGVSIRLLGTEGLARASISGCRISVVYGGDEAFPGLQIEASSLLRLGQIGVDLDFDIL